MERIHRLARASFALVLLLIIFSPLHGQFEVGSTSPVRHALNVRSDSPVLVTFSTDVNPATLTSATWLVYGSQSGLYSGSIAYDGATRTAQFRADSPFKPGEDITLTLTSAILSSNGVALRPFQSSFTVSVEFGTGVYDQTIAIALSADPENPSERDPSAIFAADFNNDRFVDLAVVNNSTNSVSILNNNFFTFGGSFQVQPGLPVGNGPVAVSGADFDNDGWVDLAVCNFDDNSISVLRNTAAGSFVLLQTVVSAEHPTAIVAEDFDSDGLVDLAITALGVNQLQVFQNQGNADFSLIPASYPTGASPYGLNSGDFDGDGDSDIVVSNSGDNSIFVFKNDGRGSFSNAGEIAVPDFPTVVRSGDLLGRVSGEYGNRALDLVIAHPNINSVSVLENRSLDGGFVLAQEIDAGLRPPDLMVADLDTSDVTALTVGLGKDHDLDIAVPNMFSNDVYAIRNQFNNGFNLDPNDVFAAGETPSAIAGGDFDKDGDIDLAVTNLTTHAVTVLLNKGGNGGRIDFTLPNALIDFGRVSVCDDSTRIFPLVNPTDQTIILEEISTTLPVFIPSPAQATIAPGGLLALSVTFAPDDTLAYQDTLLVRGQVFGRNQEVRVALRGQGIQALISAAPDTLNFGGLQPPTSATLPLQIVNDGNGTLVIKEFRTTDPSFSVTVSLLTVLPHSSQSVQVSFAPAEPISYLDTLTIFSNDCVDSALTVLLLGGPNNFAPEITSADTVTAIEDIFVTYTATANDSDGTQPRFIFRDLPGWLSVASSQPDNNSVQGAPREGDRDTSFTLIAHDVLSFDTLAVYVRVLPVNDPPVFVPMVDQTVVELQLLSFDVTATDPEDSTLVLQAFNLPVGAVFTDNGNKSGTFSWLPGSGTAGDYPVTFIVREVFEPVPLSDTLVVNIRVREALPDLSVAQLTVTSTEVAIGRPVPITATARADFAAVRNPFRLTFLQNGQVVQDTLLASLAFGAEFSFIYVATFNNVGSHEVAFRIDRFDQVQESNEENNDAILLLQARPAAVSVRPNPFTPNNDGFNDVAVFDFADFALGAPELRIFTFRGQRLVTLNPSVNSTFRWNGRDSGGREQQPGIYLYVLSNNRARVKSGYIVLAR